MLVYGDATRRERCADTLAAVAGALDRAAAADAGLPRHSLLVEALIASGELAQGIADREFRAAGDVDRASPAADAALALTMALARAVSASWESAVRRPVGGVGDRTGALRQRVERGRDRRASSPRATRSMRSTRRAISSLHARSLTADAGR